MLEKEIEKKVCTHARETGWYQRKWTAPGYRGVPDRLFFIHGHCLCIEFKSLNGRASALQEKEIRLIRSKGITVLVVDNVTEGKDYLDYLKSKWAEVPRETINLHRR